MRKHPTSSNKSNFACFGLLFGLGILFVLPAASATSLGEVEAEITALFQNAKASIVKIQVPDGPQEEGKPQNVRVGSGFAISGRSEVLTTHDLVGNAQEVSLICEDRAYPARLIASDPLTNIALLQAPPLPSFLQLGNSDQVSIGAFVVLVGCAYGTSPSPEIGIVSARDLHRTSNGLTLSHFRTTISVAAGQIGGPVLDINGQAIGMIVANTTEPHLSYALPINAVSKIRSDLARWGRLRQPWLGFSIYETYENQDREIRIGQVFPNTPAYVSDIQRNDRIVAIGGRAVHSPADVLDITFFAEVGRPLTIQVERGSDMLDLNIQVAEKLPGQNQPSAAP
jgi:serine protease Do